MKSPTRLVGHRPFWALGIGKDRHNDPEREDSGVEIPLSPLDPADKTYPALISTSTRKAGPSPLGS